MDKNTYAIIFVFLIGTADFIWFRFREEAYRGEIWSDLRETTKNWAISVQAPVHFNKDPELAIRTSLRNQRMVKRGKGTKSTLGSVVHYEPGNILE